MHIKIVEGQEFRARISGVRSKSKGRMRLELELERNPVVGAGLMALQDVESVRVRIDPEEEMLPFGEPDGRATEGRREA